VRDEDSRTIQTINERQIIGSVYSDSFSHIALAWLPCRDLSVAMATAGVDHSVPGRPLRHADCSMADAVGTATHQQQQQQQQ